MTNQNQQNPQNAVFELLDSVPSQFWYTMGIGTIAASALLQISGQKNLADFVGKWPPTFLLIGLYHKMLRPGDENAAAETRHLADKVNQAGREAMDKMSQQTRQPTGI